MRYSETFILLLFLSSCITPYDINSSDYRPSIVIQGMITDQQGPYVIQVSNAVPIASQTEETGAISGASVVIEDDLGNSETLVEQSSGSYYTNTLQGVIGRTYTLTVTTSEGDSYKSAPETLNPVGDFAFKSPQFVQNEDTYANQQISSTNGFNINIDAEVFPEQEKRVWWRWTGTFHVFTHPELETIPVAGPGPPKGALIIVPNPPQCSGYIAVRQVLMGPFSNCTCCDCWYTQYNKVPLISDTRFVSNDSIKNFNVAFVEANRRTLYDYYYLEVQQLSVSPAVYNFWESVKAQQGNSSNLFQVPPPKTTGNIKAISSGATPVIGYFAASSVKKHALRIDQSYLPKGYQILPMDTIRDSCLSLYSNSTNVIPLFW